MSDNAQGSGRLPLAGLVVIDFGQIFQGPYATLAAREGRGGRDQGRAAVGRAAAQAGAAGDQRDLAVRDAEPEQARGDA